MKKLLKETNVIDVGIALSHLELAAKELGKKVSYTREHQVQQSQGKYITTLELL
jgi:hypothetical protein